MAYSSDLRERVIAATRTMDKRKVAAVFQISYSTVKRWASLGAGVKPKSPPGAARRSSEKQAAALLEQFKAHPDATLDEHRGLWLKRSGISLSNPTMSRWMKRLGWTRKKTLNASERDLEARAAGRIEVGQLDPQH